MAVVLRSKAKARNEGGKLCSFFLLYLSNNFPQLSTALSHVFTSHVSSNQLFVEKHKFFSNLRNYPMSYFLVVWIVKYMSYPSDSPVSCTTYDIKVVACLNTKKKFGQINSSRRLASIQYNYLGMDLDKTSAHIQSNLLVRFLCSDKTRKRRDGGPTWLHPSWANELKLHWISQ